MSIKELDIMVNIHKELHYGDDDIERFYAKRKWERKKNQIKGKNGVSEISKTNRQKLWRKVTEKVKKKDCG